MIEKLDIYQLEKFKFYKNQLKREWFFSPDGVHGIAHIQRVLIFVLLLGVELKLNDHEIDLLCLCAIYHDIGRSNDYYDEAHGLESYKKIQAINLPMPKNDEDKNIINFIIIYHCIDDDKAIEDLHNYDIDNKALALKLYKAFKDCDALDRVRVDLLDINYLRFEQTKKYIPFAWNIFKNPENMAALVS
jgi:HD superfamily phosphodiesterase